MRTFFQFVASEWRWARIVYYRYRYDQLVARVHEMLEWARRLTWKMEFLQNPSTKWSREWISVSKDTHAFHEDDGPLGLWAARYVQVAAYGKYVTTYCYTPKSPYSREEVAAAFEEARAPHIEWIASEIARIHSAASPLQEQAQAIARTIRALEGVSDETVQPLPKVRVEPPPETKREKLARLREEVDKLEEEILHEEQASVAGAHRRAAGIPRRTDDS